MIRRRLSDSWDLFKRMMCTPTGIRGTPYVSKAYFSCQRCGPATLEFHTPVSVHEAMTIWHNMHNACDTDTPPSTS